MAEITKKYLDQTGLQSLVRLIAAKFNATETTGRVTLSTKETATDGALKTYELKQGTTTVGTIDIPKDFLVKSGRVVTVAADEFGEGKAYPTLTEAGTYIELVLNVKEGVADDDKLYIAVGSLIEYVTEADDQSANDVQVTVSNDHKVSADLKQSVKNEIALISGMKSQAAQAVAEAITVTTGEGAEAVTTVTGIKFKKIGTDANGKLTFSDDDLTLSMLTRDEVTFIWDAVFNPGE